jgi:hypothetical protein
VVLILSQEFISKKYPMEELQLLLEWRRAEGSKMKLLPVFYAINYETLGEKVKEYKSAAAGSSAEQLLRRQQWVEDLQGLQGITGLRKDQVGRTS